MKYINFIVISHLMLVMSQLVVPVSADELVSEYADGEYGRTAFINHLETVKWETAGLFAGITVIGIKNWNWGSQNEFKTNSEGWAGQDTGSGGMDKLGHAFSTYFMTNFLSDSLSVHKEERKSAALSSAIIATMLMTYVEVFDGYSEDHGFSHEDMVMNLSGAGLAYLRNTRPGFRELVDFRMEYIPSNYEGYRPLSDYAGHKYLLAFKLSGINALQRNWPDSPLMHLELHLGYYARGFTRDERSDGLSKSRNGYAGVGLNLNELIFGKRSSTEKLLQRSGRLFFEHVQLPYTSVKDNIHTW